MEEVISMSHKDLDRLHVLRKVQDKDLSQVDAARLLDLDVRHVRRLSARLAKLGPKGLVSKLIGRCGNHCKHPDLKQRVLALLRERYEGFGPTLAAEKLLELHDIKISNETIRIWMIENNLWIPRKKRSKNHIPRMRRPCFGELIQADGSPHRWVGEDGPEVNATVLDPIKVKGKVEKVLAYSVIGLKA